MPATFKETHHTLEAPIRAGKGTIIFHYYYDGDLKLVRMESDCGCSLPTFFEKEKRVAVEYSVGNVPKHLQLQGRDEYTTTKKVTITQENEMGTEENTILSFTVTIKM